METETRKFLIDNDLRNEKSIHLTLQELGGLLERYAASQLLAATEDRAIEITTGWISVDERLPKIRDRYLCYVSEQGDLGLSNYTWNCYYGGEEYGFADNGIKYKVTHWMKLPAPPVRESDNK